MDGILKHTLELAAICWELAAATEWRNRPDDARKYREAAIGLMSDAVGFASLGK